MTTGVVSSHHYKFIRAIFPSIYPAIVPAILPVITQGTHGINLHQVVNAFFVKEVRTWQQLDPRNVFIVFLAYAANLEQKPSSVKNCSTPVTTFPYSHNTSTDLVNLILVIRLRMRMNIQVQ